MKKMAVEGTGVDQVVKKEELVGQKRLEGNPGGR